MLSKVNLFYDSEVALAALASILGTHLIQKVFGLVSPLPNNVQNAQNWNGKRIQMSSL